MGKRLLEAVLAVSCIICQGLLAQVRGDCHVEPPPVQNSYRRFSGNNIIYTCRDNIGSKLTEHVKTCTSTYNAEEFHFCTYNCGNVFPPENGARRAKNKTDVNGAVEVTDADYYECIEGFTAWNDRMAAPYNQPTCDRHTQIYKQPRIGCFIQDVNFVNGCIPLYIGAPSNKLDPTVDAKLETFTPILTNGKRPAWECKLNSNNLTEVTDIIITALAVVAVAFNVVDENGQEHVCGEFVSSKSVITKNIRCPIMDESYPTGVSVRIYSDLPFILYEVAVQGRPYIQSCPLPPPLHGMVLETYSMTNAVYKCIPGWHALRGNGFTVCNKDRKWKTPDLVCSDKMNLATKYSNNHEGLPKNFPLAIDGVDSTCTEYTACSQTFNQTILFKSRIEVEAFIVIFNRSFFAQTNLTVVVGKKDCKQAEIFYVDTFAFTCPSRPISDQITIYFITPENATIKGKTEQSCTLCEVKVFGREIVSRDSTLECYQHPMGLDYKGQINVTVSGRSCQSWNDNYPHHHNYGSDLFSDDNIVLSSANYCRYPVREDGTGNSMAKRPWCFTTDPTMTWEECGVPMCQELCKLRSNGADYAGYVSSTRNNHKCLFWPNGTTEEPTDRRDFTFVQDFPDWHIKAPNKHNFCRNPASSQSSPWCYINKYGISELCDIPLCPTSKDISFEIQLTISEFQAKVESLTFSLSLVLLNSSQHWQPYTKDDITLVQICSEDIAFFWAVFYESSSQKYLFLAVNCTDRADSTSTSQTVTLITTDNTPDLMTQDDNLTVPLTTNDFNPTDSISETSIESPCKQTTLNMFGLFSSECYNVTPTLSIVKAEIDTILTTFSREQSVTTEYSVTEDISTLITTQKKLTDEAPTFSTTITSPTTILYYTLFNRFAQGGNSASGFISTTTRRHLGITSKPRTTSDCSKIGKHSSNSTAKDLNLTCSSMLNARIYICSCSCSHSNTSVRNEDASMTNYEQDFHTQLRVDPFKVSRNVRRKLSAEDNRPASVKIGVITIVVIVTIIVIIILSDLRQVIAYITVPTGPK